MMTILMRIEGWLVARGCMFNFVCSFLGKAPRTGLEVSFGKIMALILPWNLLVPEEEPCFHTARMSLYGRLTHELLFKETS